MNYVEYTIMANMMLLGIASFAILALFLSIVIMMFIDNAKYKNKNHIDMSDGLLYIDDKSSNLNTNAQYQICFGDIYDWNEDWKGKRCFNWYEVEKYLEELEKGVKK